MFFQPLHIQAAAVDSLMRKYIKLFIPGTDSLPAKFDEVGVVAGQGHGAE